jgi:hypothetical protein
MRCTPEADQSQPEAGFKNQRLSVQQIATPEVRNGAFLGRFWCFLRSAIIALIHAGKMRVWGVVAQGAYWISKPAPSATRPSLHHLLTTTYAVESSPGLTI